jgi:hypothetical protein
VAHPAGQDADADQAERLQLGEHLAGQVALEHALLEWIAVDEQWRDQRTKAVRAELVPRSRPREGEIAAAARAGVAGDDRADDRRGDE